MDNKDNNENKNKTIKKNEKDIELRAWKASWLAWCEVDQPNEGDEKSKKDFNSLHFQSVAINLIQMLLLTIILFI